MPKITFLDTNGAKKTVDAKTGVSLMEVAVELGIDNIPADCGGACACATCHVIVEPDWTGATGEADEMEADMLDFAEGREDTSRLSCQIQVTDALDGLVVRVPEL